MFKRHRNNFFERKLNILLLFIVLILFISFFFLEWFVPVPKTKIEKMIEKEQFKN